IPRPPRSTPFPYTTLFRSHHSEGFVAVTRAQTADSSGDKSSGGATIRSGIAVTVASDSDDLRPLCFTANVPRIQNCCDLTHERRSEEHTSELQSRENLVCR